MAVLLFGLGAFFAWRLSAAGKPDVAERWALYVEKLQPEAKLVVLSASQRYTASREFTSKLLSIVGIKASIELGAWADVHYFIDAGDPAAWSFEWDRKTRVLRISAPAPDCLPPAVRTETIEISVKGANLLTKTLFRLKEEAARMEDELSADLLAKARAARRDQAVREGVKAGLEKVGMAFAEAAFGRPASRVDVVIADVD